GSEINIHLEVVETGTTGKKLVGTSDWITVNEGTNVVVIVLREDSDTVTAVTQTYNIGDEYRDDSGALKGYVFEVSDSYIKIVATNHSWDYSWCGHSNNITDWGAVSTITDGQAMYNKMAENTNVIDNVTTIFYYAKTQKNETDSGWYIPTKDELNAVFNMNKTHQKVSGLSGDYWSSSIASITGDYTAYYVSITGDGIISSGTAAVDVKKKVIVVKKIDL
ncbi:MAG: hypothetical protein MSL09_08915, partial [Spirochaetia bacterium]|nr:hypothetical protein [Spirochaetia bacterium]